MDSAGRGGASASRCSVGRRCSRMSARRRSPNASSVPAVRSLMTADDIFAGKAGFQKADLMDYGSLYGMGSYYGQDYTAWTLIRLAGLTEARIAQAQFAKPFDELPPDQQAAVRNAMREQLQRVDLTQTTVSVPDALAGAIGTLRDEYRKGAGDDRPRIRMDPGPQPDTGRDAADRRLPDLFGADHGRAPSGCELVVDRELALRAARSATRRRRTPSSGPGQASASPSSHSAWCCSSTSSG